MIKGKWKSKIINTKGDFVKMNKLKKIFMLVLIAAVVAIGVTGCKSKSEHPEGESPSSEPPAKETPSEEHPSSEHPAGEHPSGEHPK